MEAKIDAFEMYMYRRLLKISWTQKINNAEVLRRIGRSEKVLLTMIKERKLGYIGHVARGDRY
jgi:ribosomal protein S10